MCKVYILKFLPEQNIRSFSHTSKGNRHLCLDFGLIKYKLSKQLSQQFYDREDDEGIKIAEQVNKGARVVSLNLSYSQHNSLDPFILGKYITWLDLNNCPQLNSIDFPYSGNVLGLNLLKSETTKDISKFTNVRSLVVGGKKNNLLDIEGIDKLSKLDKLFIEHSNISNISGSTSIKEMILHDCPDISDISSIKKLNKVLVESCPNIVDFSQFLDLEYLTIGKCNKLSNSNVEVLSELPALKKLNISYCHGITEINGFNNLETFIISNCYGITDINGFKKIDTFMISNCHGLQRITNISTIKDIKIYLCLNLRQLSFNDIFALYLNKVGVDNMNGKNIKYLNMDSCNMIADISNVLNIDNLLLHNCNNIRDLSGLTNDVRVLSLICMEIDDVSTLTFLRILNLYECVNITDVSMIQKVNILQKHPERRLRSL